LRKVIFTRRALADLREIGAFIAEENEDAAVAVALKLRQRCLDLVRFPNMGHPRDDFGLGYRSVTQGNYIIFYKPGRKSIRVLRILHTKQDYSKIQFE